MGGDTTMGLSVAIAKELGVRASELGEAIGWADGPVMPQVEELGMTPEAR
jgi:hypothetical protein